MRKALGIWKPHRSLHFWIATSERYPNDSFSEAIHIPFGYSREMDRGV